MTEHQTVQIPSKFWSTGAGTVYFLAHANGWPNQQHLEMLALVAMPVSDDEVYTRFMRKRGVPHNMWGKFSKLDKKIPLTELTPEERILVDETVSKFCANPVGNCVQEVHKSLRRHRRQKAAKP